MIQKYVAFIKIVVTETLMETYSSGKIKEKKIDRNYIDTGKDKKTNKQQPRKHKEQNVTCNKRLFCVCQPSLLKVLPAVWLILSF